MKQVLYFKRSKVLENKLIENNLDVSLLVIGTFYSQRLKTRSVAPENFEGIKSIISEIILANKTNKNVSSLDLFVPMKFSFVIQYSKLPFPVDFYFRIRHSSGEDQYVKRLSKGETFTEEEIEKYRKFSLDNVYIHRTQVKDFINFSEKKFNCPKQKRKQKYSENNGL